MSFKHTQVTPELHEYLLSVSVRENESLRKLREETRDMAQAIMQIAPEQGQFMQMLVKLTGAVNCIEVGVFTGYSALSVALALPENGKIIACDISEEWTSIGKKYWKEAGVDHKIDLRIAPAATTLENLLMEGRAGSFDFAFIDADKTGYATYYELILRLLKQGGLMVIDNTLWDGKVADKQIIDADTNALQQLNQKIYRDDRVDISLLPISDGVTLVRKR